MLVPPRSTATGFVALLATVAALLAGCVSVPIPISRTSPEPGLSWTDTGEVLTLKFLYDYSDNLQNASRAERLAQYRRLAAIDPAQSTTQQRLQLALLLSGIEPELTDYDAAIEMLRLVYQQLNDQPLLSGYVRDRIDEIDRLNELSNAHRLVRQQYRDQQRLLSAYRRRDENGQGRGWRETDQQAAEATSPEAGGVDNAAAAAAAAAAADGYDDADGIVDADDIADADGPDEADVTGAAAQRSSVSFDQRIDAAWRRYARELQDDLSEAAAQLERQNGIIDQQAEQILELEAKIKALSAIERNLNQREQ